VSGKKQAMTTSEIKKLIQQGEGISVEFKSSSTEVSSTTYETVCAFLNRSGGHVILGVNDSGKIIGVQCIESMIKNFINNTNNDQQFNPTFSFSPEVVEISSRYDGVLG
jgi:ATP-dependent DNA helicase RecG